MFEPCPVCGGSGLPQPFRPDVIDYEDLPPSERRCNVCVRGRVVSESVIEEMAKALHVQEWKDARLSHTWEDETHKDYWRDSARAAARVVLEHMEDSERKTG